MNSISLTLILAWLFTASLLILQPWFSRKNILFGIVFGSAKIWNDEEAKRIRLRYLISSVTGCAVIGIAISAYLLLCKSSV